MTRVDFYILHNQNPPENFACALSNKIIRQGLNIHIHTESRESAVSLDDYLWTFNDISFLPHQLADSTDGIESPIIIGWNGIEPSGSNVLINLNTTIPDFAGSFNRIIEIVAANEPQREQARERYREYRQRGYELHNHDME